MSSPWGGPWPAVRSCEGVPGIRVYLLEPYYSGSHRQWAEGYREHSRHEVHLVTHEGRFWKWRLTGGFVTIAESLRDTVEQHGPPDVLLATSMLNVPGLLGLLNHRPPVALYMHENQITYPAAGRTRVEAAHGLVNWYSTLASDAVAFNSEFHRTAFFEGLEDLLGSAPDRRHGHLIAGVEARSQVVPVGVDLRRFDAVPRRSDDPPLLLWNHRWDPDKCLPEVLSAFADLAAEGREFRVALAGEPFVGQPNEHADEIAALGDRVVHVGYLPRPDYDDLLRRSDVVVSAARQEFFGVSVVEAMYAGAFPVLPNALVYPERIPPEWHDICLYRGADGLADRLRWVLEHSEEASSVAARLGSIMGGFDWSVVGSAYDDWLDRVVDHNRQNGETSPTRPSMSW
jgi:glycosyltransferase involved in cell wall biosynthesis